MTLPQAIAIIEKYQENINDQVVRMDDVFAPDEYYLAVATLLPILKCLNCLSSWAVKNTDGYIPRCDESNHRPDVSMGDDYVSRCKTDILPDADELPFG